MEPKSRLGGIFWSDDFNELVVWDKWKKISWTKPQSDVIKWALENLLDKKSDDCFMEDNPDFLTDYGTQMFFFLDQLNLLLDLAYDESREEYRRTARIVNAIIDKLLKHGAVTAELLREVFD